MLAAAFMFSGLVSCNSETGTNKEGSEGYGAEQQDPGDMGDGGATNSATEGATMDQGDTSTDEGTGVIDTTGTSATMKTKTEAGTSQSSGTVNTSKSETTKNVEVKKP